MRHFALPLFLLSLSCHATAQTGLRAGVLDVESQLSARRDLMVTVSNMSKLPSTLDSVAAEIAPGCRYQTAVGALNPGAVRTVTLATRQQIFSCNARSLDAYKRGRKIALVPLGVVQPIDATPSRLPGRPPLRPIAPVLPLPPNEPADAHVFKISANGQTGGEAFSAVGDWSMRVVR